MHTIWLGHKKCSANPTQPPAHPAGWCHCREVNVVPPLRWGAQRSELLTVPPAHTHTHTSTHNTLIDRKWQLMIKQTQPTLSSTESSQNSGMRFAHSTRRSSCCFMDSHTSPTPAIFMLMSLMGFWFCRWQNDSELNMNSSITVTFAFMHFPEAFIQSDLQQRSISNLSQSEPYLQYAMARLLES